PLLSRLRKVIVAARTDTLILRQLDFRNSFATAGALLKKTPRNFPLFAALRLDCWFLENCHGFMRVLPWQRNRKPRPRVLTRAQTTSSYSPWQEHRRLTPLAHLAR